MRRLILGLALVALAACAKPNRQPATTLDSPTDLVVRRVCAPLGVQAQAEAWQENCDRAADASYALVANSGNRFIHAIRVDTSNPYYLDYDRSIPGETGIIVPEGPTHIEALSHPTMAVVASHRERSFLSVVEFAGGSRADLTLDGVATGTTIALTEPVGALVSVVPAVPIEVSGAGTDSGADSDAGDDASDDALPQAIVVAGFPRSRTLTVWVVTSTCDGSDEYTFGCRPAADFTALGTLALPGIPVDVAVAADGRAWVAMQGRPSLSSARLFGTPDADETCEAPPCLEDVLPVTWSCSDGVDDDGDGLVDADDPECFDARDEESGEYSEAALTACTDGLDNDGDGAIDADDDGCRNAGDRDEGDGYDAVDGSGDGSGQATEPGWPTSQDDVEFPGRADQELPACSNGRDDDGDGHADWPADADCYGPNDDGETAPPEPLVADIALTDEEDLLLVLERRTGQVLFFDTATGAMIRRDGIDAVHDTYGTRVYGEFPGPLVADTSDLTVKLQVPIEVTDGGVTGSGTLTYTHAQRIQRRVHVATTDAFGETIVIDAAWYAYTGEPGTEGVESVGPFYEELYEPIDVSDARGITPATVIRIDCSIPSNASDFGITGASCSDTRLPAPRLRTSAEEVVTILDTVPTDTCGAPLEPPEAGTPYRDADPSWYAALPQTTERQEVADAADCTDIRTPIETRTLADGYGITGGEWSVVFEGVINGTERIDGLLDGGASPDRGWITFAADEPCLADQPTFCEDSVRRSACPDLWDLCQEAGGSTGVCDARVDVCAACPSACPTADFCAAGVMPGDILEMERLPATGNASCAPFEEVGSHDEETVLPLEYEVCSVAAEALEIAPFGVGCDGGGGRSGLATSLPLAECVNEPLEVKVRATGWLVRVDQLIGPSPYAALDGRCVLRPDAESRVMRAELGEVFESPFGPTFALDDRRAGTDEGPSGPAYALYPRDFSIDFDVATNFARRSGRQQELLLGPATSALAVYDTPRGHRIVSVDESQSFLWIFNGDSFRVLSDPLP